MMRCECERESEVLAWATQPGGMEYADAELKAHAAQCAICSEAAAIARVIREDSVSLREEIVIPGSERAWWMAQLRARREGAEAAARPLLAAELLAVCGGAIALCALIGWYGAGLDPRDALGLLARHGLLTAGIAGVIFGVPAVAYLAAGRE